MTSPNSNPIAYAEIPVTDMDRAVRFYTSVFGTDFDRQTIDGYEMALFPASDGAGATAALAKGDVYRPSKEGAIVYFRVGDIGATVARAGPAGAAALYPVKDVGEFGMSARSRAAKETGSRSASPEAEAARYSAARARL